MSAPWLDLIGVGDGGLATLAPEAAERLAQAEVVFGGQRHLAMLASAHPAERQTWRSPFADSAADLLAARGRRSVVLATGDPSWFGPAKWLRSVLSTDEFRVWPAPSAFSLAAAKLGWALEDCLCRTVHGRPVEQVAADFVEGRRLLVLSEDGASPAALAACLVDAGYGASDLQVLEHLGGAAECVRGSVAERFDLIDIAALNTIAVECRATEGAQLWPPGPGLPDDAFRHDGKMTKRVLRALALAALSPRAGELLWDVGSGSGAIAVEWCRSASGARALAIEPNPERLAFIRENRRRLAAPGIAIVERRAPEAFDALPAPDAVFLGGGLTEGVFAPAFARLKPGGRLVAHAVTLESEAILLALHAEQGGDLLRISVDHAAPVGPFRGWRPAMPVLHWCLTKGARG
ncbi:bifunctional cobalt-precorrin-7 (C(5))-methyltransferase/cobalt-precorrin-6B (C(15))-methyltransferase [Aureimonas sp. AU40]|uniref:bifunctional cobalt-precorrin-7 (C(5))-methyltransferase/cobalt-precorrin-6B (C(15))-methyltransferase n=1 Tax=Aureimonas sp. AU40 TaxID=1637747 RepID=UPI000780C8C8|nr:bifunctional cobalt-precorrin-7 (C(5))-methyltransferase/cobalt-precorrin-6B (C(15))-methyltransferase [Aureimonas sp. AU40]